MHCLDLFQLNALPFHLGLLLHLLDQAKYVDRVRREHARDDRHVYLLYDHALYAHRAYVRHVYLLYDHVLYAHRVRVLQIYFFL